MSILQKLYKFLNSQCNIGGQMSKMADHETMQVLAKTEIGKLTSMTKYFRLQKVILGTNMTQ